MNTNCTKPAPDEVVRKKPVVVLSKMARNKLQIVDTQTAAVRESENIEQLPRV